MLVVKPKLHLTYSRPNGPRFVTMFTFGLGRLVDLLRRFVGPEFCWHGPTGAATRRRIAPTLPPPPYAHPYVVRRAVGFLHVLLHQFADSYHTWYGLEFTNVVMQLPFGLVLKWSDGTRVDEVLTTQAARAAGLPVPKVICYGEHPDMPHAPVSILMTRMPGRELSQELWKSFDTEQQAALVTDVRTYLAAMRSWENPLRDHSQICSASGQWLRCIRVPGGRIGLCKDEEEFNQQMIRDVPKGPTEIYPRYHELMPVVHELHSVPHKIVFTHGDLSPMNLLIQEDGHVSAIVDWEASGWWPEYWEFVLAWRYCPAGSWFEGVVNAIGGDDYKFHRTLERARYNLTTHSCFFW